MVEVRDLIKENVGDIATFCFPEGIKSEFFLQGQERKKNLLLEKLKKGGKAKIAYKEDKPVGFIEYYPIEDAPISVVGKDIVIVPCMNVKVDERKKGIGDTLIRACIEDAKKLGMKGVGVQTTDWQDFMPKTFFEKYGFTDATKSGPIDIFVIKFEEVEDPRWLALSHKQELAKGKLVIDIFHNDQCPFNWQNSQKVKKVAREFEDSAVLNEFDNNRRENILKYGTQGAIIVNGEYLTTGPPLSEEDIRKTFQEMLKTA